MELKKLIYTVDADGIAVICDHNELHEESERD